MTEIVNTAQSEAWNGYEGEHWAGNADRYDAMNGGFNAALLDAARVGTGDRVLDIGCGNGQLTRLAARRTGSGAATGVDLSGPMLARARERALAEGVRNVSFVQGDVQVYPFTDGEFEVALSRFGIMFFADPVAAFANIVRALTPGGRFAAVAVPPLPGTELGSVFGAVAEQLPTFEIGHTRGAFADTDGIRDLLTAAGFTGVEVELTAVDAIWGRDVPDAAKFLFEWGPVRYHRMLAGHDADARVAAAISAALEPYLTPDGVRMRNTAWLITATAPLP